MSESSLKTETPFWQALLPALSLFVLVVYGLVIHPLWGEGVKAMPLELIFILASAFVITQLLLTGHKWRDIERTIVQRLATALPAFFILFSIGLIIASWIICGTIPMLVYYGLNFIDPTYLYLIAFLAPVIFSTLTGTSWGSIGTIGVVMIGIAQGLDANLGITAGAIAGGAYFGDKMSPLSDTTNMAALACDVKLFDHIHSMLYTTVPAAIVASIVFTVMGFVDPVTVGNNELDQAKPITDSLESIFNFNVLLLLPPIIVLIGSLARKPIVPTLLTSVFAACLLSLMFQNFGLANLVTAMNTGFDTNEFGIKLPKNDKVALLLNRGGLYELNKPIVIAFMIFIFTGAMGHIRAMPIVVGKLLAYVRSIPATILASLLSTGLTSALTSNQYATSFIIGDAFKDRYDELGIDRKVLSRSLEDYGTVLESIVPWTTTAIFVVDTLGVPFSQYWYWQILTLANLVIAALWAILGIGCFKAEPSQQKSESDLSSN